MKNKCFAYSSEGGKFSCLCLKTNVCTETACRFYKTKEQVKEEHKKVTERLRSLDKVEQLAIKTKYNISF